MDREVNRSVAHASVGGYGWANETNLSIDEVSFVHSQSIIKCLLSTLAEPAQMAATGAELSAFQCPADHLHDIQACYRGCLEGVWRILRS